MAPRQIRPIRVEGNIAYVPLTRGLEAVIDAADVPLVEGRNWHASPNRGTHYAATNLMRPGQTPFTLRMHRAIMNAPDETDVDHADGDGLNNRRSTNLRFATNAENHQNQKRRADCSSGVKGVWWDASHKKWRAQIKAHKVRHRLGDFNCRTAAALAYAKASKELHGQYGRLE